MNKIKEYKEVIISIILVIVLTLLILSNQTVAYIGGDFSSTNTTLTDSGSTTTLAWFITNFPAKYMNESIYNIFKLNQKDNNTGLHSSNAELGYTDVYYSSAMCIHHGTGNNTDSYQVKISNVIEIESPGIIKIYKFTGSAGSSSITYNTKTFDLSNESTARTFWTSNMGKTASTFNHTKMKTDLSAFAYLDYLTTSHAGYSSSNSSGIDGYEGTLYYWWRAGSDTATIREYVKGTGLMDTEYDNTTDLDEAGSNTYGTTAKNAVANILETPSLTKSTTSPAVEYSDGKAYIGPLQANFAGGTLSLQVEGTTASFAVKNTDGRFSSKTSISTGQVFYAVVSENTVKNETQIDVKLTLSYSKYRSRIVLSVNKSSGGQSIMFHAGQQETGSLDISWSFDNNVPITLVKKNNGTSIGGVEFDLYKGSGNTATYVDTLTSTTVPNGTSNTIQIEKNKTYELRETKNNSYGYKGGIISSNPTITNGNITRISDSTVRFTVTGNATITINNEPKLVELKLHKVGADSENLAGVKFALGQDGKGYIKITGNTSITSSSSGIDMKSYAGKIKYVTSATNATQFITDSNGQLYFKNLEQYSGIGTKYTYKLCETENSLDGYEMMLMSSSDVTWPSSGTSNHSVNSSKREISFTIDNAGATVEITLQNRKQIGEIVIHKTDQSGSKNLAGVQFRVLRGTNNYIILKDASGKSVSEVTGTVTIGDGNVASGTTYSITTTTTASSATTFITGSDGKITIENVKIYDDSGNKYKYGVEEIANDNYGYKNMGMTSSDLSVVSGGTKSGSVDTTNRRMYFTINDNNGSSSSVQVKLSRKNTEELFKLNIKKVGSNNENLPGVKFYVLQDGKYIQLSGKSSVTGEVTIDKNNAASSITFTENKDQATVFVTNSSGQITINNLEVYSAPGDKFEYTVQEIENTNYGYKNMSTDASNFLQVTGGTKKSVSTTDRSITFEPNSNTATITVTRTNTQELFDLTINKAGDDGAKLAGVEFKIQIETGSYLQLQNNGQKVTGTVSIKQYSSQSSGYEVKYVTDKNSATTFVTDSNGQITINNLEIYSAPGEKYTYTVEEVSNSNYGFKNMDVNGTSTTVSGASQVTKDGTKITFTPDSKDVDISIGMVNNQQLFNIEIHKTGTNNKNLAGVEFYVLQDGKYARITDSSNNFRQTVTGTVTINKNNVANGGECKIEYVDNVANATTFITDSNGKIVINNLEIYSAPGTKYTYTVREIENNNYGYKNMAVASMSVSGGKSTSQNAANREISFTANEGTSTVSVVAQMKNNEELFDLTIKKIGTDNRNLAGVKFYVLQDGKYIKLSGTSPVTGTVTINKENKASGSERSISVTENKSEATVFVTDSNGQITINNLEIYSDVGKKFEYTVREFENSNYGYKNMSVNQIEFTNTTGGSVTDTKDTANKEVTFTVNNTQSNNVDVTLQMKNEEELFDLTIHKIGANNKNLAGVKFYVLQDGKYIKLSGTSPVTGTVTINKDNVATGSERSISVTGNKSEATVFVTDENGKITINNLEIYSGVNTKFEYTVEEIENSNYGYKNMAVSQINITTSGGTVTNNKQLAKKKVTFTVNNTENHNVDVTVQMKNDEQLFDFAINKVGENGRKLSGVEFLILQDGKYVQINDANGFKETVTGTATINKDNQASGSECSITFTEDESKATVFITDSNGQVLIKNVEIYSGVETKYTYGVREIYNTNYGYKGTLMKASDVSLSGVTMVGQVDTTNRQVNFKINDSSIGSQIQVKISNTPHYGNIEITKVDKDNNNKKLPDVRFILSIDNQYVQLTRNGARVDIATGTSTISKTGKETTAEYGIKYVSNIEEATKFATDTAGKIVIENLEVYSGIAEDKTTQIKYTYALYEVYNENYGYTIDTFEQEGEKFELSSGATKVIGNGVVTNEQFLGNVKIQKVDEDYTNIYKMEGIQFMLAIVKDGKELYVAVKDDNGKTIPSIQGDVVIDAEKIATSDEYYTADKDSATIFITDENGQISIENLEVYDRESKDSDKYTYKLIEIYNPYYGYEEIDPNNPPTYTKKLTANETTLFESGIKGLEPGQIPNKQELMKISGYVWEDREVTAKANYYDCVYNDGTNDIKLKDLYETDGNGKVTGEGSDPYISVKIKLYNADTGKFIKNLPDYFYNEDVYEEDGETIKYVAGTYVFVDIPIENDNGTRINYEVVFEYDGLYYTTVRREETSNGSKVEEVSTNETIGNTLNREEVNNLFGEVKDNSEVITTSGTTQEVVYDKDVNQDVDGNVRTSQVIETKFDTTTSANTKEAGYSIKDEFHALKLSVTKPVDGLGNINMGLVLREQPKLAIGSDIYGVTVEVNSSSYDYYYKGRQLHYDNINEDEVGVKFEQENTVNRYTQPIYSSDVYALSKDIAGMNVYVVYKIQLINQSTTLTSVVNKITNYFDPEYTIVGIGSDVNGLQISGNSCSASTPEDIYVDYNGSSINYKETTISLGENGLTLYGTSTESGKSNTSSIYIKFSVSQAAIKDLLNEKSTYHNASEIISYSTYYGDRTNKQTDEQNVTTYYASDETKAGKIYAGIDKTSEPGNIDLRLIDDTREGDTPVIDTSEFEDDETSAPSLTLNPVGARTVSGSIWEDAATSESLANNERLGDGVYDSSENPIANVKVELLNSDGTIAKYSNGDPAATTTGENGEYKLGGSTNKVGILPGEYKIRYTYGETFDDINFSVINTYIVSEGTNVEIDPDDYKSTIITSTAVKDAFESGTNKRWYLNDTVSYSDAKDDITMRQEYDDSGNYKSGVTLTNETYGTYDISTMYAYTPNMDIGIEFTPANEADGLTTTFKTELEKVDFGIIERPHVNMTVEKKITSLELTSQTGATIIPKGDPSNPNASMQNVKTGLDGIVPIEVQTSVLQNARLNIEYSITLTNNSEKDYDTLGYYYYGNKNGANDITPKAINVVDYLDVTMSLDEDYNNSDWVAKTASGTDSLDTRLTSAEVETALQSGDYKIFLTDKFNGVGSGASGTVTLGTYRNLAVTDAISESNRVEIVEITGTRAIKYTTKMSATGEEVEEKVETIPGNYVPAESDVRALEPDEDRMDLTITAPTGITENPVANYTTNPTYIIAIVVTFTILIVGIVIIKKKVIR